jgi:hypothetical protein
MDVPMVADILDYLLVAFEAIFHFPVAVVVLRNFVMLQVVLVFFVDLVVLWLIVEVLNAV